MYLAGADQSRNCDRIMIEQRHCPGFTLMLNAGKKAAAFILNRYSGKALFVILCGPGNNGGDGLVVAAELLTSGKNIRVILSHPESMYKGDARIAFETFRNAGGLFHVWNGQEPVMPGTPSILLIDALLGTGVSGPVHGPVAEMIAFWKSSGADTVALDMPSGLSADTGEVFTTPIQSTHTVTFHTPKICHAVTPAAGFCGEVHVADIGIDADILPALHPARSIITGAQVAGMLSERQMMSHKGTFGHAGIAGGSRNMAGAVALAAHAALSAGAGLSTALLPGAARCAFYQHTWASMTMPFGDDTQEFLTGAAADAFAEFIKGKSAVAIGPGLGNTPETTKFLEATLSLCTDVPLVLDADALNILAQHPELWQDISPQTILTPHPGEMKRLCSPEDVNGRRLEVAEHFAKAKNCIVVLKGAHTVIASPHGETRICLTGNPGMATAGAGDVLTGAIAGLLAQGLSPFDAASAGVYLHGLAGDLAAEKTGERGTTAQTILQFLSYSFTHLNDKGRGCFSVL